MERSPLRPLSVGFSIRQSCIQPLSRSNSTTHVSAARIIRSWFPSSLPVRSTVSTRPTMSGRNDDALHFPSRLIGALIARSSSICGLWRRRSHVFWRSRCRGNHRRRRLATCGRRTTARTTASVSIGGRSDRSDNERRSENHRFCQMHHGHTSG